MNQQQTPLYTALIQHNAKQPISFHVPGHKNGMLIPFFAQSTYEKLLKMDATEITGLDDLHDAEGCIEEAQSLLRDLYKTEASYFLINGSTVGNLAMILATCQQGDTVLVQRNCHQSILNGLELAGAEPIFLTPAFYEDGQIPTLLTKEVVERAIQLSPEAKAIILTYPNYYGFSDAIEDVIHVAKEAGLFVLVDEAHGAHFQLEGFPKSSLSFGADIVVHSAHKTLPAMTMGSYLHIGTERINKQSVERYLRMLQSSSPSYPIMASLDLARYYLANLQDVQAILENIQEFRQSLQKIEGIRVLEASSLDPLKVTIQSTTGLSGYALQALFEQQGIFSELADPFNVLFVLPLAVTDYTDTLKRIKSCSFEKGEPLQKEKNIYIEETQKLARSFHELKGETYYVTFEHAAGKISAELVTPYPPGIPLIMKGECITQQHIETIQRYQQLGSRFHGGSKLASQQLLVYQ